MTKMVFKNSIPLLIAWVFLFVFFCRYYTPETVFVLDLGLLSNGGNIYTLDSTGKQDLFKKLIESFGNKIGTEWFEYDVFFENNYKLAFESETAQPKLAYTNSILIVTLKGEHYKIKYQDSSLIVRDLQKNEIFNLVDSVSIEREESPQQVYAPKSLLSISTVGNLTVVQRLNTFSKIRIGIFSLITILAFIGWIRQLMSLLILGPRKFFLGPTQKSI